MADAPRPKPSKRPESRVVSAEFAFAAKAEAELPPPMTLEIAFVGRSNVGKSSLLNKLMNRKNLARTSSTPGCTRQINFFSVRTSQGMNLSLVDLPGYGYARRSKEERKLWAELIERYLLERPTLRVVALLVDVRRGLEGDDLDLLEMLETGSVRGRPVLRPFVVATKLDKLRAGERSAAVSKIKTSGATDASVYGFSTELPDTVSALWNALERRAGVDAPVPETEPSLEP